jgi:hypothetical protein
MNAKSALIFGVPGFGSHLLERLAEIGRYRLCCADIAEFVEGVHFEKCDVRHPMLARLCVADLDILYFAAAR